MTRRINGDALENRAGTAATGDVFTFNDAHADGGQWQAPGAGSASAAWPVGSIFFSAVSTNPATLLGFGTWSAIGAGRVLIGIDAGDTDFDTLGETGGAKTKAISAHAGTAVGDHTAHGHGYGTIATVAESSHTHGYGTIATVAESSHTHGSGSLATNTQGAHQHTEGTLATAAEGSFHTHSTGSLTVDGHTSHAHGTATGDIKAGAVLYYNVSAKATPDNHTITGDTGNQSASHTHAISGYTTLNGDHTHFSFTGSTAAGSSHSHGVSGSTAAGSSHSHGVSGSTSSDALSAHSVTQPSAHSDLNVVQPYLVVAMWQRIA